MIVVLPAPTMVTLLPLTVATAGLLDAYDTVNLELAVAPRENAASPKVFVASAPKVIVWVAGLTVSVWGTLVAAEKFVFPAWLAVIVVLPAPTMVTLLPLTVATAGLPDVYDTVNPELAVAPRENAASPKVFAASAAKVIVWAVSVPPVTLIVKTAETCSSCSAASRQAVIVMG